LRSSIFTDRQTDSKVASLIRQRFGVFIVVHKLLFYASVIVSRRGYAFICSAIFCRASIVSSDEPLLLFEFDTTQVGLLWGKELSLLVNLYNILTDTAVANSKN